MKLRDLQRKIESQWQVTPQGEVTIELKITLKFLLPEQDQNLPNKLELMADAVGQEVKREVFNKSISVADQELVAATKANNKEIKKIGSCIYTFKTIFGTIKIPRSRLLDKTNGTTHIPAAVAWCSPRQILISKALKADVCDLLTKQSIDSARQQLDRLVGETDILSHGSLINILHTQGCALKEAVQKRTASVFELMPEARPLLVPKGVKKYPREKEYYFDDLEVDDEPMIKGSRVQLYWEQGQEVQRAVPMKKDDMVILQPDEVRVWGQGDTDRKEVWIYTAVITVKERTYYFSADTAKELVEQVGAVLAVLGVPPWSARIISVGGWGEMAAKLV